jgi:hypothetical protein
VLHAARHRRYDRDGGLLRSIDQAAAKLNCKSFSGKADGLDKTWAVENARDTLKDAIGKWTAGAKGRPRGDPIGSETANTSLLAGVHLAGLISPARRGDKDRLHDLLEGRGLTGGLRRGR